MNITIYIGIGVAVFLLIVVFIMVKLYKSIKRIDGSFAKLGYVTREDAKKYFGEAAEKVVDMNSSFTQQYEKSIETAVKNVLSQGGQVMEQSLTKAEQDAGKIILKAQEDAKAIVASAQHEIDNYQNQAIGNCVEAMEWTLEQYAREHFDLKSHEAIINKYLEVYINERRSH